jgi:tetratricopeptide (TPR) repeat protein
MVAGFPPAIAAHAAMGTPVADAELPAIGAHGLQRVLGDARVSVLVFFRPDQARSAAALRELAACHRELAGKAARWVALVPDGAPSASIAAMGADAGIAFPVLVDKADAFYASLGLSLHPVVAIVDRDRRLAAFEPFRSVDFCAVVSAQLRFVLGEITRAQLAEALSPAPATAPASAGGKRYRSLAEALLRAGNPDKALEYARRSVEHDPRDPDSQAVLGNVLAAKGDCPGARAAFSRALVIDNAHVAAKAGIEACASRP